MKNTEKMYFAAGFFIAAFVARLIWWVEYCLKVEANHGITTTKR